MLYDLDVKFRCPDCDYVCTAFDLLYPVEETQKVYFMCPQCGLLQTKHTLEQQRVIKEDN